MEIDRENRRGVRLSGQPDDQLRLIIDNVPPMVWTARPDGFCDFINWRWLEYTGLSLEKGLGRDLSQRIPKTDLNSSLIGNRRFKPGRRWSAKFACAGPMENIAGSYIALFHFRDDSGNFLKWIATVTDIHALKLSE